MAEFVDRTVVISGAAGGIGQACAEVLAARGARIAVLDIAEEQIAVTTQKITDAGGTAQGYTVDVTSAKSVDDAFVRIEHDLGPVTLAVGAAGIIRNHDFLELPADSWDRTLEVNLKGMFLFLQAAGRRARSHGGGSLVAIASVAGRGGRAKCADYAASKAGVISLVRSAALALAADHITVNAICPGVVDTKMTRAIHQQKALIDHITAEESFAEQAAQIPLGRIVSPGEIAETVSFLLSPAAAYVTGQALNVCGGLEMD
ncbi:MAG TPA: SDR family NAD(P)-dependent oxidoreductase [Kribbella sp.]